MRDEAAYRFYVTDTAYYQGRGNIMSCRYSELISDTPKDNRTGDEIAAATIEKLDLIRG